MAKRHHTPEPIIHLLRQAEVELSTGQAVPQVCSKLGVSKPTYDRGLQQYGGLRLDQVKRLKDLERENERLKRLVAQAEPDQAHLREAAAGNV
jgi:hypothetical protein